MNENEDTGDFWVTSWANIIFFWKHARYNNKQRIII